MYGVIAANTGYNKYKVRFKNGTEKVCHSNTLGSEKSRANAPQIEAMAVVEGEDADGVNADEE